MYSLPLTDTIHFQSIPKVLSFEAALIKGGKLDSAQDWNELLFKVANSGCRESFKNIFNHFYPILVQQNLKAGLTKELSTELAQESLLKVWRQAISFDATKGAAALWIYVIARNVRFDYFRKQKNDSLNISSEEVYGEIDYSFVDENNPEINFEFNELRDKIQYLPADQRSVIYKFYFEGMTHQEIAEQENIPLGTVKSRIRLAIVSMKELLAGKLI
ncbi:MAG: sigma-70 family RNA polymerase sigma factor [Bacteriovoracaceae bacterium]